MLRLILLLVVLASLLIMGGCVFLGGTLPMWQKGYIAALFVVAAIATIVLVWLESHKD